MNNKNLISVLLPTYNCEKHISESINSIINQTHKNWELLLIYDHSNDHTLDLLKYFSDLDKRIKIIYNEYEKGLVGALNTGINNSKGEYIMRMDSDDISVNNRMNSQLKYSTINNLDICGCHYISVNENGSFIKYNMVPVENIFCRIALFSVVPFAHPTVLIKKSFLKKNNLNYISDKSNLVEDLILWQKMFQHNAIFGNVPEYLLKYRYSSNSITRKNLKKIKIKTFELNKIFLAQQISEAKRMISEISIYNNNREEYLTYKLISKLILINELNFFTKLFLKKQFLKSFIIEIRDFFYFKLNNLR